MISIVLSSHNGAGTLPMMFDACLALAGHRRDYEILAIDNASVDRTAAIIRSYESRLPIRYLSCDRRGKNIALNHGIEQARGDLLVFTDDDIVPAGDWLKQFEALADEHESVDVFGGRIVPKWPGPPPRWILERVNLQVVFGLHPEQLEEGSDDPWTIWGGNMMVRADLFRRGVRFNESVGPAAGPYVMGSETELTNRLSAAGHRCYFSNRPVVQHIVRARQFDRAWILGRARRFGKQRCMREWTGSRGGVLLWGMPRWRVRSLVADYLASIAAGAWLGTESSFAHSWSAREQLGFCEQFRVLSR